MERLAGKHRFTLLDDMDDPFRMPERTRLAALFSQLSGYGDANDRPASARPHAASNSYGSVMTIDYLLREIQAESIALIAFGGKEWPKQLWVILHGDAVPVVSNHEVQLVGPFSDTDVKCSGKRNGVKGINKEIRENLQHLADIDSGNYLSGQILDHMNALCLDRPLMNADRGFCQSNGLDCFQGGSGSCETKGLTGDGPEVCHLLFRETHVLIDLFRVAAVCTGKEDEVP